MNDEDLSDAHILESWQHNAIAWVGAVRGGEIESRRLVTDQAVLEAVLALRPATALDLGCGEGWLTRALCAQGVKTLGVDAVPALVQAARAAGPGDYQVATYEHIAQGALSGQVDCVVCNFSLLGEDSVTTLLPALASLLTRQGHLLVQTLHPLMACGEAPYRDGWRSGSWAGFNTDFSDPPPWYFRTLESWVKLLYASGLDEVLIQEPVHPLSLKPASLILQARAARS
ncbi:class I SAM-dependent methyltransferase [Pseudomonas abieticivorans]|uniref:class I SAM-dependent methyltransferase n=1 Tax=Pseudomonas abieticivorans TaxID=2931382 RepID=UPI0020C10E21|nr:methyltransferase domain-containing protein [Pseudomonas sp. PIA16]